MKKLSRIAPALARTQFALDPYRTVLRADPCAYCGGQGGTIDHVQPIAYGGADHWENLTGACAVCNGAKSARGLLWFLVAPEVPLAPVPPRHRRALVPERCAPPLLWSFAELLHRALRGDREVRASPKGCERPE